MKWYFPAWHGDHRLEADGPDHSTLEISKPSSAEVRMISEFLAQAKKRKWTEVEKASGEDETIRLWAPIAKTGKLLLKYTKPKKNSITAVRFESGKTTVVDASDEVATDELVAKATEPTDAKPEATTSAAAPEKLLHTLANAAAPPKADKGKSAVTTTRPTPCCPQCMPGAIDRASEVLLAFLNDDEHAQWKKNRTIEIVGGLSGHRYLLAHRHSAHAHRWGRMCYDLDDNAILHFHDWSVPPEEEVLAAKLILEHKEPWLRNEATCLGGVGFVGMGMFSDVFKNPFGGYGDGTESAGLMDRLGIFLTGWGAAKEQAW